ncbi:hypothetical protein [Runella aurantiaca]|jgi:hypothetical protein|uniref:LPXTG cell wall anchor domain-containing protein n=1 Tax=Runella aurantiaca TaxID=2282308 RepID=A0A369I9D2_9BACT|nr:hypothetical protein [Runella aurantiaca]RDB03774.1 hypothetical protein DVG78_22075 [Runella aurantiaca]
MKKLTLFLFLMVASSVAFADLVEVPTGSPAPVSDVLLLVGVLSIAVLLFVRYRRARQKH